MKLKLATCASDEQSSYIFLLGKIYRSERILIGGYSNTTLNVDRKVYF